MKKIIFCAFIILSVSLMAVKAPSIYLFTVNDIDGKEKALSDYKGKVLLVVNVASECGFTKQYKELQALYMKNQDSDFEILAFPCNQFGKQEPGTGAEIKEFCSTTFNVTFPLFEKLDVNGDKTNPVYKFLKSQCPIEEPIDEEFGNRLYKLMERIAPREVGGEDIRWNFTKFLLDKNGNVVNRFEPTVPFEIIQAEIDTLFM